MKDVPTPASVGWHRPASCAGALPVAASIALAIAGTIAESPPERREKPLPSITVARLI
jgi:hypothetical protein